MNCDPEKVRGAMPDDWPAELDVLSHAIIAAAIEVHSHLRPGLREKFYERALIRELIRRGHSVGQQVPFSVVYKGDDLGSQAIDVVVDCKVVVECKSVRDVTEVDKQQMLGYMRFANLPLGLLINFHVARLVDGVTRRVNWPLRPESPAIRVSSGSLSVVSVPPL